MNSLAKILFSISLITLLSASCGSFSITKKQDQSSSAIAYKGEQGKSAMELLKSKYTVRTESYSTGEVVKAINGQESDAQHYWGYTINGKESLVNPGQYITQDGDSIEWKLMQVNSSL